MSTVVVALLTILIALFLPIVVVPVDPEPSMIFTDPVDVAPFAMLSSPALVSPVPILIVCEALLLPQPISMFQELLANPAIWTEPEVVLNEYWCVPLVMLSPILKPPVVL